MLKQLASAVTSLLRGPKYLPCSLNSTFKPIPNPYHAACLNLFSTEKNGPINI
jgi:hypothetical protein